MARIETLTSPANPLIRQVRRAVLRGALTEGGCCIAESFRLLAEALRSGCDIQAVLTVESGRAEAESRLRGRGATRIAVVPDALFRDLSATETSQGVLALVRPPEWELRELFWAEPLVVVIDGVQDPGNAGAILRAAEAFGASGVIFAKGSVSPYNPKAVRASAGSVFRVPLVCGIDADKVRTALEEAGLMIYVAAPEEGPDPAGAELAGPCAIVIGSEGQGVSDFLRRGASSLRIRTTGVESLNAAVAAGILLYEARRQRSGKL